SPVFDRDLNPGGIWRPVRVATSGSVRMQRARVACVDASAERARLACNLTLDAASERGDVRLHALVRGPDGDVLLDAWRAVTLAAGRNELAWTLVVEQPPLWWPPALGAPPLCTFD